ncbi:MAG: hypothetical protein JWP79_742 [Polaromonas sp.]|jgi:hypothetical protein|nr:hypothetical protein [Polaromonas sp.]MDB5940209.1 hypothetical protein [Polaromonas sp.]
MAEVHKFKQTCAKAGRVGTAFAKISKTVLPLQIRHDAAESGQRCRHPATASLQAGASESLIRDFQWHPILNASSRPCPSMPTGASLYQRYCLSQAQCGLRPRLQTSTSCQSRNRRRHVTPEPQPISWGSILGNARAQHEKDTGERCEVRDLRAPALGLWRLGRQ